MRAFALSRSAASSSHRSFPSLSLLTISKCCHFTAVTTQGCWRLLFFEATCLPLGVTHGVCLTCPKTTVVFSRDCLMQIVLNLWDETKQLQSLRPSKNYQSGDETESFLRTGMRVRTRSISSKTSKRKRLRQIGAYLAAPNVSAPKSKRLTRIIWMKRYPCVCRSP